MTPRDKTSNWASRLVVGLGVLLGLMLPIEQGCGADCPELSPEPSYRVVNAPRDWVEGSGVVTVTDGVMRITYATIDGSTWEVGYDLIADPEI